MTKIVINREKGTLEAYGHAMYAECGKDVVCAAVSALCQTVMQCAIRHGGYGKIEDGYIMVKCDETEYKTVLEAIKDGLQLIAAQYGKHVALEVI